MNKRRAKIPSDYLTNAQMRSLNGELKTYQLGKPMTWTEFDILPDDLKILYIGRLRNNFGASNNMIAEMFGVDVGDLIEYLKSKGIPVGYSTHYVLDIEAWNSFLNGET